MAQTPYKVQGKYQLGDIYEARLSDGRKVYLQYIGTDALQIKSHVVRIFKNRYSADSSPSIENIVNDPVDFYAHVISVEFGMQDGTWTRVGNSKNIGDPKAAFFRSPGDPDEQGEDGRWRGPKVSKTWYLWRLGDSKEVLVKQLDGENTKADSGSAIWPKDILVKIETDKYPFVYPDYK